MLLQQNLKTGKITFAEIQKAERERNAPIGDVIFHLVGSAEDNANDTIYDEKTVPEAEWDRIALASLEFTLGCCRDESALQWFRDLGVKW